MADLYFVNNFGFDQSHMAVELTHANAVSELLAAAVDGRVEYGALLREKELPEFVKPKSLRRSQSGHPWRWDG